MLELFDTTQVALGRAKTGALQRHDALAANIANAETPGYQKVDLDFHGQLSAALAAGRKAVQDLAFAPHLEPGVARGDGNGVDIDVESAELSANALEYEALASVASARTAAVKAAIGIS